MISSNFAISNVMLVAFPVLHLILCIEENGAHMINIVQKKRGRPDQVNAESITTESLCSQMINSPDWSCNCVEMFLRNSAKQLVLQNRRSLRAIDVKGRRDKPTYKKVWAMFSSDHRIGSTSYISYRRIGFVFNKTAQAPKCQFLSQQCNEDRACLTPFDLPESFNINDTLFRFLHDSRSGQIVLSTAGSSTERHVVVKGNELVYTYSGSNEVDHWLISLNPSSDQCGCPKMKKHL